MNEGRSVGHNFERDHPSQIWFSGFKGEDLNVIFDQNMPNLNCIIGINRLKEKFHRKTSNIC